MLRMQKFLQELVLRLIIISKKLIKLFYLGINLNEKKSGFQVLFINVLNEVYTDKSKYLIRMLI